MAKTNEIDYIKKVCEVDKVSEPEFIHYLANKPFSDARTSDYLIDLGQIMRYLPPRPARILDLGVGSGWTSEIFARCDYEVVGLDIAADMIKIAN